MKKAFDANVSRARPRLRVGAMMGDGVEAVSTLAVEALAQQVLAEGMPVVPDLSQAVKTRAVRAKPTVAEALHSALEASVVASVPEPSSLETPTSAAAAELASLTQEPAMEVEAKPREVKRQAVRAHAEAPATVTEVQTAPPPEAEPGERRERLKERLRAVRENPRPDPLPETVAEAGVLAVERISALQSELTKARALNLALTQDLEAARRQAERATEEARVRMDEARRLASEMEGRAKLLTELERELESLEGERNEALLALQESRQALELGETERAELRGEIDKKSAEVEECLAEEERLAAELEQAQAATMGLRRAADALKSERDTLARQVSDLTRERAELLEARKALEAVHRALAKAAAR